MERRREELRISERALREIVARVEPGVRVSSAALLSGGLANTNYRVETNRGSRVLRLVTRNPAGAEKEVLLLGELASRGVPVPRLLGWSPSGPAPSLWLELLPGKTLEEALPELDAAGAARVGRELGAALGRVHAWRFAEAGDLVVRAGALVVSPWELPGEGTLLERFVDYCLESTPAGRRLGALGPRVRALTQEAARRWETPGACLVHADFKPCNLFVEQAASGWELRGILDWEFAHAGSPFSDYGNLFRARTPALPAGFEESFVAGLAEEGVELARDWRARSACVDLTSALDFLSSERDLPQRHAACLAQVRATLALPLAPEEG